MHTHRRRQNTKDHKAKGQQFEKKKGCRRNARSNPAWTNMTSGPGNPTGWTRKMKLTTRNQNKDIIRP
jgi:hypothetical protein